MAKSSVKFTRFKHENEVIKVFNGRSKVAELPTKEFDDEDLAIAIDYFEKKIANDNAFITDDIEAEVRTHIEAEKTGKITNIYATKYRVKYGSEQHCGDEIAVAMNDFACDYNARNRRYLVPSKLKNICKQNKIDFDAMFTSKNGTLNNGLVSSRVRNILRHRVEVGEYVIIGDVEFNKENK